jgi:hypothetical protein
MSDVILRMNSSSFSIWNAALWSRSNPIVDVGLPLRPRLLISAEN